MHLTSPILLIAFNRPKHVSRVLDAIREQRPKSLYVFQDGPRKEVPEDQEKCQRVRDVISELVDWECDLHTLYADRNYGCGAGPMTGKTRTPLQMEFKQCISAFLYRLFSTSKRPRTIAP